MRVRARAFTTRRRPRDLRKDEVDRTSPRGLAGQVSVGGPRGDAAGHRRTHPAGRVGCRPSTTTVAIGAGTGAPPEVAGSLTAAWQQVEQNGQASCAWVGLRAGAGASFLSKPGVSTLDAWQIGKGP